MELEDTVKVVASIWGAKYVQFLAALAVLPRRIEEKVEFNRFFQIEEAKQRARQEITFCPPNRGDDLCRVFEFHPSSMVDVVTIACETIHLKD